MLVFLAIFPRCLSFQSSAGIFLQPKETSLPPSFLLTPHRYSPILLLSSVRVQLMERETDHRGGLS